LAIGLFLPDVTSVTTWHNDARQTAFLVAGNKVGETDFKPDTSVTARVFVSQILVDAPATARAIVTFGDSITDGDGSTVDANHRWPDFLAARFVEAGGAPVGVLNAGISGAMPFEETFKSVSQPLDYFYNPEKEKTREAVNQWIRESKELDGVIDFDALTRDPQRPSHIQAAFDSGDTISIPTTPVTRRWPIRLTSGY
jgi:hypothetical protein